MHWFACSLPEALWASCLWLFFFLCCTSRKDCFRFWNTFWIRISDWHVKWLLCFSLRSSARWNSWSAWCMAVGLTTSWAEMELEEAEFVCGAWGMEQINSYKNWYLVTKVDVKLVVRPIYCCRHKIIATTMYSATLRQLIIVFWKWIKSQNSLK